MTRLTIRIDFEGAEAFGPGKARLLELIERVLAQILQPGGFAGAGILAGLTKRGLVTTWFLD